MASGSGAFGVNVRSRVAEPKMRHIFGCNVRFSLFFGYYCCQFILELLTPDYSAEILSFDRHSEFIKLFSSMCYDREQLLSLRRENLKPTRSVRKSIFRNRLCAAGLRA